MPDLNDIGTLAELRDLIIRKLRLVSDEYDDCGMDSTLRNWDRGIQAAIDEIEKLFKEFEVKQ